MSKLDKYEVIKKLGAGMFGDTFLVKHKDKQYAMKVENMPEEEIKNKDLASPIWREIEFATKMHKECPNHIMKLYEYDIIENCKHQHTKRYKSDSLYEKDEYYENKMNSPFCLRMIYSLVDTSLEDYIKILIKKPQEVWYSIFIQFFYVIYCLHKHGYTHNDIHGGNIGFVFTKNKTITVFKDKVIPTFGLKLVLLDYGRVLHEKYDMSGKYYLKNEKQDYEYNMKYECHRMIGAYFYYNEDFNKINNKLKKIKPLNREYINFQLISNSFLGYNINEMLNRNKYDHDIYDMSIMYLLINPDQFQKILFGDKKYKSIPFHSILDPEDFRYVVKFLPNQSYTDIKEIGYYFINKLKMIYSN